MHRCRQVRNRLSLVAAAALLASCQSVDTQPASTPSLGGAGYAFDGPLQRPADATLVWSDEFDGPALDRSKWAYDTEFNKSGWFNKERQYYSADRSENARITDGVLVIEARRERLDPKRSPTGAARIILRRGCSRPRHGPTASTRFGRGCPARAGPGRRSGCCPSP